MGDKWGISRFYLPRVTFGIGTYVPKLIRNMFELIKQARNEQPLNKKTYNRVYGDKKEEIIKEIKSGTITISEASKQYIVCRQTVSDWIHGNSFGRKKKRQADLALAVAGNDDSAADIAANHDSATAVAANEAVAAIDDSAAAATALQMLRIVNVRRSDASTMTDPPIEDDLYPIQICLNPLTERFRMTTVDDDGNCFWRAIAWSLYGDERRYKELKQLIYQYIHANERAACRAVSSSTGYDYYEARELVLQIKANAKKLKEYADETSIICILLTLCLEPNQAKFVIYAMEERGSFDNGAKLWMKFPSDSSAIYKTEVILLYNNLPPQSNASHYWALFRRG